MQNIENILEKQTNILEPPWVFTGVVLSLPGHILYYYKLCRDNNQSGKEN